MNWSLIITILVIVIMIAALIACRFKSMKDNAAKATQANSVAPANPGMTQGAPGVQMQMVNGQQM